MAVRAAMAKNFMDTLQVVNQTPSPNDDPSAGAVSTLSDPTVNRPDAPGKSAALHAPRRGGEALPRCALNRWSRYPYGISWPETVPTMVRAPFATVVAKGDPTRIALIGMSSQLYTSFRAFV